MNYDQKARDSFRESTSSAVWWVIISSYLYYVRDESILSDEVFDKLMKTILDRNIKHSLLSHLITEEDLKAGSLFRLKPKDYPQFIIEAGERIIRGVDSYV